MTRRRQRLANFEARSVQLIAACTLGLAGLASVPPAHATRTTGQVSSQSGTSGGSPSNTQATRVQATVLPAGKAQR